MKQVDLLYSSLFFSSFFERGEGREGWGVGRKQQCEEEKGVGVMRGVCVGRGGGGGKKEGTINR